MCFSDIQNVAKTASIYVGEGLLPPVSRPPLSLFRRDPWTSNESRPIDDRTAEIFPRLR
jgi:hypothetical protein